MPDPNAVLTWLMLPGYFSLAWLDAGAAMFGQGFVGIESKKVLASRGPAL